MSDVLQSAGCSEENCAIGEDYTLCKTHGEVKKVRIKELYVFEGLGRAKTETVRCGDLCAVIGLEDFEIGDTLADLLNPEALQRIEVDEPTMSMVFTINNSPFFGKEGKFVTSRHLRTRLMRETEKNLALRVEETNSEDTFQCIRPRYTSSFNTYRDDAPGRL